MAYPSIKTFVLDAQKNHQNETVLLSTHKKGPDKEILFA